MNVGLLLAYGLLAIGQVSIGVNVVSGKYLLDVLPIHVYLCGRFFVSAVFLVILLGLMKEPILIQRQTPQKLNKKDWLYLTLQALTGGFLFNVMFYWGIQFTTATSAGIISSALPAIIAVLAFWILGERLGKWKCAGIVLAMLGILIINLDNTKHLGAAVKGSYLGDFVILLSMVPEALYSIFNKYTNQKVTPLGGAMIVNIMIFLMLLPFGAFEFFTHDLTQAHMGHWFLVFATGFSSLFFFWFWSRGLIHVPASTAAIFTSFLPVSTTLMAWFFLNETFGFYDGLGMLCVLSSIVVGTGWLSKLIKRKRYAASVSSQ